MANKVFANNREVSCKAATGKSVCAFPDVCFTPPSSAGVPVPYPNTGLASDSTRGSRRVKISGREIMLKNKSYFKKSTGNEAGSAARKGALTGTIEGKVYFNSWSMNVRVEGENVTRHLDLMTHNHASSPGNTPVWPYLDSTSTAATEEAPEAASQPGSTALVDHSSTPPTPNDVVEAQSIVPQDDRRTD